MFAPRRPDTTELRCRIEDQRRRSEARCGSRSVSPARRSPVRERPSPVRERTDRDDRRSASPTKSPSRSKFYAPPQRDDVVRDMLRDVRARSGCSPTKADDGRSPVRRYGWEESAASPKASPTKAERRSLGFDPGKMLVCDPRRSDGSDEDPAPLRRFSDLASPTKGAGDARSPVRRSQRWDGSSSPTNEEQSPSRRRRCEDSASFWDELRSDAVRARVEPSAAAGPPGQAELEARAGAAKLELELANASAELEQQQRQVAALRKELEQRDADAAQLRRDLRSSQTEAERLRAALEKATPAAKICQSGRDARVHEIAAELLAERKAETDGATAYHAVALDFLRVLRVHQCEQAGIPPSASEASDSGSESGNSSQDCGMELPGQQAALALLKAHGDADKARKHRDARSLGSGSGALSRSSARQSS